MKAKVHITLKNGVLDPQGRAIAHALGGLGFGGVEDVRQGKYIELELKETDQGERRGHVRQAPGQYGDRELRHRPGGLKTRSLFLRFEKMD